MFKADVIIYYESTKEINNPHKNPIKPYYKKFKEYWIKYIPD